ncbi:hypothetical protein IAQ61_003279 [Plenodomus lingam]|uniref:Uncharacterized protein n=1 Tax=Leptosphaeria maculans (strain JN3 / isolate v23.1.3 / race Av1-4-5-6-7-8) TaxID=985895 RepID=E5AE10_LEPMJ|nr:hypothetical protein LEMA_P002360.1 [Plenodomus lingam JN3]KAH9875814.1 hypothetical protein IAQ61_003279 [Plenodomus lingam]CBY01449.1 hypothetical protein LEMA_P002360.1 [Plenodomus lingam JN3]
MAIESALQRADQYIQKQMHKFEQQRRGRTSQSRVYAGYGQLPPQESHVFICPSSQVYDSLAGPPHTPPEGPIASPCWRQEFDTRNQRGYYTDFSTGLSQRESPYSQPFQIPHRSQTFVDHPSCNKPAEHRDHDRWPRQRGRSFSQPQTPISSASGQMYLSVAKPERNASSQSPNRRLSGSVPPGAHLDMRTGQLVSHMFPPDQDPNSLEHEVGKVWYRGDAA